MVHMEKEDIILVDGNDRGTGTATKEASHKGAGMLHRAFSVFVFNDRGELLIQQRSSKKKTWPLFWSNSCCSHPNLGESIESAMERKMEQELGFSCKARFIFKFQYSAKFDEWSENELDHVFVCRYSGAVKPNKDEVEACRFIGLKELKKDMAKNPDKYTPWFRMILDRVSDWYEKNKGGF